MLLSTPASARCPRGTGEPPELDWDRFIWPEAVTWFARGLGAARQGEVEPPRAAGTRLQELETASSEAGEKLFARNIRILRLAVSAWLAHLEQDRESSIRLMRDAAEPEAATPKHAVTPAPTLPAYELLGDLELEQGQPEYALADYERSLQLYPYRFNSLLGAARAVRGGRRIPGTSLLPGTLGNGRRGNEATRARGGARFRTPAGWLTRAAR